MRAFLFFVCAVKCRYRVGRVGVMLFLRRSCAVTMYLCKPLFIAESHAET